MAPPLQPSIDFDIGFSDGLARVLIAEFQVAIVFGDGKFQGIGVECLGLALACADDFNEQIRFVEFHRQRNLQRVLSFREFNEQRIFWV